MFTIAREPSTVSTLLPYTLGIMDAWMEENGITGNRRRQRDNVAACMDACNVRWETDYVVAWFDYLDMCYGD